MNPERRRLLVKFPYTNEALNRRFPKTELKMSTNVPFVQTGDSSASDADLVDIKEPTTNVFLPNGDSIIINMSDLGTCLNLSVNTTRAIGIERDPVRATIISIGQRIVASNYASKKAENDWKTYCQINIERMEKKFLTGAISINLGQPVFIYCRFGQDGQDAAAELLQEAGITIAPDMIEAIATRVNQTRSYELNHNPEFRIFKTIQVDLALREVIKEIKQNIRLEHNGLVLRRISAEELANLAHLYPSCSGKTEAAHCLAFVRQKNEEEQVLSNHCLICTTKLFNGVQLLTVAPPNLWKYDSRVSPYLEDHCEPPKLGIEIIPPGIDQFAAQLSSSISPSQNLDFAEREALRLWKNMIVRKFMFEIPANRSVIFSNNNEKRYDHINFFGPDVLDESHGPRYKHPRKFKFVISDFTALDFGSGARVLQPLNDIMVNRSMM